MPVTQDQLDAIDLEIVSNVTTQSNQFSDQAQTNRNADDTLKLRRFLAGQVPGSSVNRTRYAATRKGV